MTLEEICENWKTFTTYWGPTALPVTQEEFEKLQLSERCMQLMFEWIQR